MPLFSRWHFGATGVSTGFSTGFDTAVPPVIVEEVGRKKNQPPPEPTVVLVTRSGPDGDARLKKAFDLILKLAARSTEPQDSIALVLPAGEGEEEQR